MKTSPLPPKPLILLGGACLLWVGILSLAFMVFTGTGVTAGWILAGALFLALGVWAVIMFREFTNAPDGSEATEEGKPEDGNLDASRDRPIIQHPTGFQARRTISNLREAPAGLAPGRPSRPGSR